VAVRVNVYRSLAASDESDSNIRNGVQGSRGDGNDEGDDSQVYLGEDRITMDIIATEPHPVRIEAGPSVLLHARMVGLGPGTTIRNLDVEVVISSPLLPTDRKWAIRFNADATATIILGMKDYGRGWFSSYFTNVAAARLGIPFRRFRVYYSATSPAVLQTPVPSATRFHRSHIGPVANAVVDIIEGMCDRVIEKGRSTFAALAGVGAMDVGFDGQMGRFFVLERARSGNFFEIAEVTSGRSSRSLEVAGWLRPSGEHVITEPTRIPPAAISHSLARVW
jgi:Molybdopterin-binding domain of aldehyde dehydrogenase